TLSKSKDRIWSDKSQGAASQLDFTNLLHNPFFIINKDRLCGFSSRHLLLLHLRLPTLVHTLIDLIHGLEFYFPFSFPQVLSFSSQCLPSHGGHSLHQLV